MIYLYVGYKKRTVSILENLDSRSETDTDFTRLLGANAEPGLLELC